MVGRVEILREHETQHQSEADRHVGVAAEIEVNLERIGDHAVPRIEKSRRGGVEDRVRDLAARIGQQDLFRQAEAEERDAAREAGQRVLALLQLRGDVGEAEDRAGDELREHRDEASKIDEVADRARLAPVHIDGVAHRVKRVEANTERKDDLEREIESKVGQSERGHQRRPAFGGEIEILKEAEQAQVRGDRHYESDLLRPRAPAAGGQQWHRLPPRLSTELVRDKQAADVVKRRGEQHQHDEQRINPTVEHIADQRQQQVPVALRHRVVEQQRKR